MPWLVAGAQDFWEVNPWGSMTGQSLGNLIHPEDLPKFKALCTGEVGSAGAVKLRLVHFRHLTIGHGAAGHDVWGRSDKGQGGAEAASARRKGGTCVGLPALSRSNSRDSLQEAAQASEVIHDDPSLWTVFGSDPLMEEDSSCKTSGRRARDSRANPQLPSVEDGKLIICADYVSLEFELVYAECSSRATGQSDLRGDSSMRHVLLVASIGTASPSVKQVSETLVLDHSEVQHAFRHVSGQYKHVFTTNASDVGRQREVSHNRVQGCSLQEAATCDGLEEEVSLLERGIGGLKSFCVRSMTNLIYRHLLLHLCVLVDTEGIPTLVFHVKFKFWGVFETPWKFMAQMGINAVPVKFVNFTGQTSATDEVYLIPVFFFNQESQTLGSQHFICRPRSSQDSVHCSDTMGRGLVCEAPHVSNSWSFTDDCQPELLKTMMMPNFELFAMRFRKVLFLWRLLAASDSGLVRRNRTSQRVVVCNIMC